MKTAIPLPHTRMIIEFYMAGTLLLLKQAGWAIHYLNCQRQFGSVKLNAVRTRAILEA